VLEDDAGLADARVAVDQGHLAEVARALVGRHLLADGVGAGLGPHLDGLPSLEADLEAAHHRPPRDSGNVERTVPSVSLRSGVVKTSSVGTLTMCGMPSTVSSAPVSQRWPSGRPTRRSVPGPTKRSEANACSSRVAARWRSRSVWSPQAWHGDSSSRRGE